MKSSACVYLPVETPTSDFYGGHRPGNNLFADTLVAVDLKTGQRKWHFQLVHHSVWNMDIAAAPILDRHHRRRHDRSKRCRSMGKQAMMYVFDRAHRSAGVADRRAARPARRRARREVLADAADSRRSRRAYDHQGVTEDALIDFTPELRAEALRTMAKYKIGPIFTPPVRQQGRRADRHRSDRRAAPTGPAAPSIPETHDRLHVPHSTRFPVGLMPPPMRSSRTSATWWGTR